MNTIKQEWRFKSKGRDVLVVLLTSIFFFLCADKKVCGENFSEDLIDLSLEELMSVEVTSVSRKAEKLAHAPAAVFLITSDDILRSGVTTIQDALKMVPGLQVARINSNRWAITSRGFNSLFANKLLVMIDGRTVYDPIFSGVFWSSQDIMLEDIDRIEVIRGPGATLWGANAVNGVINISTKNSKETTGTLISGGAGTFEKIFGSTRLGGNIGKTGTYRVYAKYFDRGDLDTKEGPGGDDDWDMVQGGFRADWETAEEDKFTLQGDIYDGKTGQKSIFAQLEFPYQKTIKGDPKISGGNFLSRWNHSFSETSDMTLQLYYDRTERDELEGSVDRDTIDIDFQHRFPLGNFQEIVWGAGYRYTHDDLTTIYPPTKFDPDTRDDDLFSGFLQDELFFFQKRLRLTLGSKFEHNDYSGFEIQPNGRIAWIINKDQVIWASASRAVRTPSRQESDVTFIQSVIPPGASGNFSPFPMALTIMGDDDFDSETLVALELGYRIKIANRLSVDIATFYNTYDDLRIITPGASFLDFTPPSPSIVTLLESENSLEADAYGIEAAFKWHLFSWWRLNMGYTFLYMDLDFDDNIPYVLEKGDYPDHQISIRSSMDLPHNLKLDLWVRYVDNLSAPHVSAYTTMDICLIWEPCKGMKLSLQAANLLESEQQEYIDETLFTEPAEVEQSFYGKVTFEF